MQNRFGYEWSKYPAIIALYEHQFAAWVHPFTPQDFKSKRTLDAGCGTGALASVLAAVALGIFISVRTRREFHNLVDAFDRVAGGDLNTTVMAYSEGEFSQLADSFSEMTRKLRLSQELPQLLRQALLIASPPTQLKLLLQGRFM